MPQEDPGRPLALVLSHFSAQARGRLLQLLPETVRDRVANAIDEASGLLPSDMSFVELVLNTDLERLARDQEEGGVQDLLVEVVPLQVCDLMGFVLLHATTQQAGEVFLRFPPALQGEVLQRVCAQNWAALHRRLGRGELEFLTTFEAWWNREGQVAPPEFAAEMLRHIPSQAAIRRLLTDLDRLDPEAAACIQRILYRFEDLVRLSDREFQDVFFGTDPWDLALALREASSGLRRRVLANISERRQQYLIEDEVTLEDLDEEEVEVVQRRILEKARVLFETGKISTYMGSIEGTQELSDEKEEEHSDEQQRACRTKVSPSKRNLRPIFVGVSVFVVTVLVAIRLLDLRFASPRESSRKGRGSFFADSNVQRNRMQKGKEETDSRSNPGRQEATDLALVEGDVLVFQDDKRRNGKDQALEPGDWIETGESSRAVVRLYADSGQLQMESESAVKVGEEGEDRTTPPRLRVRLGNVWVFVKNPAVEVHSPLVLITATQGALYRLRVVLDATTTVVVKRGTVWVKPLAEPKGQHLVLGLGERVRLDPGGGVVHLVEEEAGDWLGIF